MNKLAIESSVCLHALPPAYKTLSSVPIGVSLPWISPSHKLTHSHRSPIPPFSSPPPPLSSTHTHGEQLDVVRAVAIAVVVVFVIYCAFQYML